MTDPAPLHCTLLHGHAWGAWLCTSLIAAQSTLRLYVHRLAAPPTYPNQPLTPIWLALCAAPRRGVACQLMSPLPSADNTRAVLNRSATSALATAGWQLRYCAATPAPQCRLYLLDDTEAAIGDMDLLNSHLAAEHLNALALHDAACCAALARAYSNAWTAARLAL